MGGETRPLFGESMMQSEEEAAIEEYISALKDVGKNPADYKFEIKNGQIRLGHVIDGYTQWNMMWYTPEQFTKLAKRRRQNTPKGNPRKPVPQRY